MRCSRSGQALETRLLVCFLLGTPEPVCCAPLALDPSQGTRVQRYWLKTSSRAACRSLALTLSASCLSVPRALLRSNWDRTGPGQILPLLGTRGRPSTPGRPGQVLLLLGTCGGPDGGPSLSGRPDQAVSAHRRAERSPWPTVFAMEPLACPGSFCKAGTCQYPTLGRSSASAALCLLGP